MNKTLLVVMATLFATSAGAAYKCVDDKGRTHIGDTPPPGCAAVMMYEITKSGHVIREIPPTLTPEQLKAKQAEDAKKMEADKIAAEQKRKDMTLLQTYASEKEFDVARDRNIEPLRSRIRAAEDRIKGVEKREKEVAEEMEFYKAGKSGKGAKGKEMPKNLTEESESLAKEKVNLRKSIGDFEKEIGELRNKYDVDKKRWVALKAGDKKDAAKEEPRAEEPKKAEAKARK